LDNHLAAGRSVNGRFHFDPVNPQLLAKNMGIFAFSIPEDEKTLLIAKAHWSSYLAIWLKIIVGGTLLALVLNLLLGAWWESHWGRVGLIVVVAAALAYILIDFWNRFLTTYIITQCRLVDITQEKFFRRVITEIDLDEVEEVIVKQTWWDRLFGKGHVLIKLKSDKGALAYYDIHAPERVREILEGVQKETTEIMGKEGKECDVILKDDREHKVPLSYSYYGEKAKQKKNGSGLIIVKKNAKKPKK